MGKAFPSVQAVAEAGARKAQDAMRQQRWLVTGAVCPAALPPECCSFGGHF